MHNSERIFLTAVFLNPDAVLALYWLPFKGSVSLIPRLLGGKGVGYEALWRLFISLFSVGYEARAVFESP